MGLSCCTLTGALGMEEWRHWDQHPARKDWDVIMDLGAGAFSEVGTAGCRHHTGVQLSKQV